MTSYNFHFQIIQLISISDLEVADHVRVPELHEEDDKAFQILQTEEGDDDHATLYVDTLHFEWKSFG